MRRLICFILLASALSFAQVNLASTGPGGVRNVLPVANGGNGQNARAYADIGSANAYAVTLSPVIGSYADKMILTFKAAHANTTASALAVNGLAAKTIKKQGGNADLVANDIRLNQFVTVWYDVTNDVFQMVSQTGNDSSNFTGVLAGDVSGAQNSTSVDKVKGKTVTYSGTPAANDLLGFSDPNTLTNLTPGNTLNSQVGDYAILTGDRNKWIVGTKSGAMAYTIAAANSVGFESGWVTTIYNGGTGNITLTPTTSTINGAATMVLIPGASAKIQAGSVNYTAMVASNSIMLTSVLPAASNIRSLGCGLGSPTGSVLTTSETCYIVVPYACTIAGWNILIDAGTATLKTWRKATGTAIPTVTDSISTSGVAISSGTAVHSTTVSDFTSTAIAANDILAFNLSAVATAKFVYFSLQCNQ